MKNTCFVKDSTTAQKEKAKHEISYWKISKMLYFTITTKLDV
jgi:hypothetical protein